MKVGSQSTPTKSKVKFLMTEVSDQKANKDMKSIKSVEINNMSEKKKKLSSYLIKNRNTFEKTTSQVLNFMVNEETQFADLTKIEDYYRQKALKYNTTYNNNALEIEKKKKQLKDLEMQIEQQLVSSIKFNADQIEDLYQPEIEKLKKKIEQQSHDLQSYTSTYTYIYEQNVQLTKRLQENLKFSQVNDKQYDKYKTIQQNALRTFKMQKNLLRDMKDFEDISARQFNKEVHKKRVLCNRLEIEVLNVKKEFADNQVLMERIKKEINEKEKQIEGREKKNIKISTEFKQLLKDNIRAKTYLYEIYSNLKVKDIDAVINKFQQERIQFQGYNTQFFNVNLEISNLNNGYSKLTDDFNKIKSQIEENESKVTETSLSEFEIKIKYLLESNKTLHQTVKGKEQYLKDLFHFLEKYGQKMSDMITSINIFSLNISSLPKKKKEETIFNNPEEDMTNFIQAKEIEINECRELLNYFLKWQRKVCFVYSNFIMNVILSFYSGKLGYNSIIVDFKKRDTATRVEALISEVLNQNEEKVSYLKNSKLNLFYDKTKSIEKKIKEFLFSRRATLDDIIMHYHQHLKLAEPNEEGMIENLISTLKTKFFTTISKYTNDFVQQPIKAKLTMNPISTLNINDFNSEGNIKKTVASLVKKSATTTAHSTNNHIHSDSVDIPPESVNLQTLPESKNLDDSYTSEKLEKAFSNRKIKRQNFFGYSKNNGEEVQHLYRRINDLNKLEFHFFKENDKSVANEIVKSTNPQFAEIYFNFKKKLTSKAFSPAANKFAKLSTKIKKKQLNAFSINISSSNKLNHINEYVSTKQDTKSNYNIIHTEPIQNKPIFNKGKKIRDVFFKQLMDEEYLIDNEREINTQIKNKNLQNKKLNHAIKKKEDILFNSKSFSKKDYLPDLFKSTNLGTSFTSHYTNKLK